MKQPGPLPLFHNANFAQQTLQPGSLDPLNALRDIHEPAPPGIWPPAAGVWILAALISGAVAAALIAWLRRWRITRPIRAALAELELWRHSAANRDPYQAIDELAALLRRVALVRYPRTQVAALTGDAWLDFLDVTSSSRIFSTGPARLLGNDRYATGITLETEVLASCAQAWLSAHKQGPTVSVDKLPVQPPAGAQATSIPSRQHG